MNQPMHILLVTPPLVQDMGFFKIDPIKMALGIALDDVLESLMTGPRVRGTSPDSKSADLYPLALPDGEGGAIPLGDLGEFGFANIGGRLEITVPHAIGQRVYDHVREYCVGAPRVEQSHCGGWCTKMLLKLPRGARVSMNHSGVELALYAGGSEPC